MKKNFFILVFAAFSVLLFGAAVGHTADPQCCEDIRNDIIPAAPPESFVSIVAKWASGSCSGYLKSDGTCDTPAAGDVSKVGTPANYEWGVWTGDGTIKGIAVTGSKVACTNANGEPVACTNLTDAGYMSNLSEDASPQLGGDLDSNGFNFIDVNDLTFITGATGGTLNTGQSAADKFRLRAFDVNGGAYTTVMEADAGNDPTLGVYDETFQVRDSADETKIIRFQLGGITTGNTRTLTLQDSDGTIAYTTIDITLATAANTVLTAADCKGQLYKNGDNDVAGFELPSGASGLNCCFLAGTFAQTLTIDVEETGDSDIIELDGKALTAGNAIDSGGTAGEQICLIHDGNNWFTTGRIGTWVDGEAD